MGWPKCNSTLENEIITEQPIWHDYTFHTLGLWVSAICSLFALAVSFFLIVMHATHYLKPHEQRHIIRILFMVPFYAAVSFLSFKFYAHSVYFEVIRDCYEAFAIASFFSLMCAYIAPDLHAQKEYFRTITPKNWIWPVPWIQKCWGGQNGIWRSPRSGLTWFNVIWVCVFQYCFIRVFMTCVAAITQTFGRYCLESENPAFAHIWVTVTEAIAVSFAMYCLIQFYYQIRQDIRQHKPLLKIAAIKLVIFLSFWQTLVLSALTSFNFIKATDKIQTPDIKVGIPAMLLCIEMAIFAVFHLWAFSYRPYSLHSKVLMAEAVPGEGPVAYRGGFLGSRAIVDSMNPWDMFKSIGRAAKWLFRDRKHRHLDVSYDLSRKTTSASEGQKPLDVPTAYAGARPKYEGEESATLLANQQPFGLSKPAMARTDQSPYRTDHSPYRNDQSPYRTETNSDAGEADIGVATSSYDPRPPPQHAAYNPQRYQQQYHMPFQGQETGVAPVAHPYGQATESMPQYQPPPNRGRQDNMF